MNAIQEFDASQIAGYRFLCGVDEAGRGALAGPVCAGATVIDTAFFANRDALAAASEVHDSKRLDASQRDALFAIIEALQADGRLFAAAAFASVEEIAVHNILGATRVAMRRALDQARAAAVAAGWSVALPPMGPGGGIVGDPSGKSTATREPAADAMPVLPLETGSNANHARIIVDGRPLKPFPCAHTAFVGGDGRSFAIAAASIMAKVTRDRLMARLHTDHPVYGFAGHKGYATKGHRDAIREHGPCLVHREKFLRKILAPVVDDQDTLL